MPFRVHGVEVPQSGKATWQMTAFWEGVLRKEATLPAGEILDALCLDGAVGQLPMAWLKEQWPQVHKAVNARLSSSRAALTQRFGKQMAAAVLWDAPPGDHHGGCTVGDTAADYELLRDAGEFEQAVLNRRLVAAGLLRPSAGSGGSTQQEQQHAAVAAAERGTAADAATQSACSGAALLHTATERGVMFLERQRHRAEPY